MKTRFLFAIAFLAFAVPFTITQQGCYSQVTLEQGGAYTEVSLAVADQAILDASHALTGFVGWANANSAYLAKWPEVGVLSAKVAAQKDGWVRDAYMARDAYASALAAYKAGKASTAPSSANLNAAIAVLTNITTQITAYRAAHPNV